MNNNTWHKSFTLVDTTTHPIHLTTKRYATTNQTIHTQPTKDTAIIIIT
jgi:hypothetical protein